MQRAAQVRAPLRGANRLVHEYLKDPLSAGTLALVSSCRVCRVYVCARIGT